MTSHFKPSGHTPYDLQAFKKVAPGNNHAIHFPKHSDINAVW